MPRHYRFAHPREDAADGCDLIAGALDTKPWLCRVCGEWRNNVAHWDRCVMCNEAEGTWLCECGHKNPTDADECQTCGRRREE